MREVGPGELRLLGRLIINPSLRQAGLARELDVSRSAVNQLWRNLVRDTNLAIRGTLDYGKAGLRPIFGWATSSRGSDVLTKFGHWLRSNRVVTAVFPSVMSSTFDSHIFFEAVLPLGHQSDWFYSQIDRFRKKPYSLTVYTCDCSKISHHINLGLFDGSTWSFPDNFRLEASFGVASSYVDILPNVDTIEQSVPVPLSLDTLLVAAALEDDYYTTATGLKEFYSSLNLNPDSGRTLRRRIDEIRKDMVTPYVEIDNIGLTQKLLVCIREDTSKESAFSQVLHAQAGTFPKARVLSGPSLTLLELDIPASVEWVTLSQVLSSLAGNASEICTFIADLREERTRLKSVVSYLMSRTSSE